MLLGGAAARVPRAAGGNAAGDPACRSDAAHPPRRRIPPRHRHRPAAPAPRERRDAVEAAGRRAAAGVTAIFRARPRRDGAPGGHLVGSGFRLRAHAGRLGAGDKSTHAERDRAAGAQGAEGGRAAVNRALRALRAGRRPPLSGTRAAGTPAQLLLPARPFRPNLARPIARTARRAGGVPPLYCIIG